MSKRLILIMILFISARGEAVLAQGEAARPPSADSSSQVSEMEDYSWRDAFKRYQPAKITQQNLEELRAEAEQVAAENQRLVEKYQSLKQSLDQLNRKIQAVENKAERIQKAPGRTAIQREPDKKDLSSKELQDKVIRTKMDVLAKQNKLKELQIRELRLQKGIQPDSAGGVRVIDPSEEEVKMFEKQLEEVLAEEQALQSQLNEWQSRRIDVVSMDELRADNRHLTEQIALIKEQLNSQQAKQVNSKEDSARYHELQARKLALDNDIQEIKIKIDAIQTSAPLQTGNSDRLKLAILELDDQNQKIEEEIKYLRENIAILQKRIRNINGKY